MVSMAPDVTVYASSFSKTVCPGIRVGYLVGSAELIAGVAKRATSAYISPNMVAQGIVNQFCRSGRIDTSIDTVRAALRERAQTLCRALSEHLPDARFVEPEGGYFLWVDLPNGTDVAAMFDAAARRGVQFVKGTDFVLEGGDLVAASGLLGRHPGADRDWRQAAGGGVRRAGAPAPAV